ncbi:MAG TPA: hypothetical protein PLP33_25870 [Leptospiraceae bacterium]|nr:hypothetical protein [Leptospiraceae bacterium]
MKNFFLNLYSLLKKVDLISLAQRIFGLMSYYLMTLFIVEVVFGRIDRLKWFYFLLSVDVCRGLVETAAVYLCKKNHEYDDEVRISNYYLICMALTVVFLALIWFFTA